MGVKFTTFGGMSMLVERSDGFKILCDPFITGNPDANVNLEDLYDVDLILVSHVSYDHLGDAPQIFANSKATMLCDRSSVKVMHDMGVWDGSRARPVGYGDKREFGCTTVRVMRAWHSSTIKYENGDFQYAPPLGYMIQVEPGVTYYAPGDTTIYDDMHTMNELYHPNVVSTGISNIKPGTGREKDAREAALEVMWLGAEVVFPGHYYEGNKDFEEWLKCMEVLNPRVKIITEKNRAFEYTPFSIKLVE
ncbi:MAG: MBL fold metallo-hydrolase [Oscillospiraceae bacterium]|nr:MBL fold metallo-hydrolase [Oscillospiraceae bacterium]